MCRGCDHGHRDLDHRRGARSSNGWGLYDNGGSWILIVVDDGGGRLFHGDGAGLRTLASYCHSAGLRTLRNHYHSAGLETGRRYNDRTVLRGLGVYSDGTKGNRRYRKDGRSDRRGVLRDYDDSGGSSRRGRCSNRDSWR